MRNVAWVGVACASSIFLAVTAHAQAPAAQFPAEPASAPATQSAAPSVPAAVSTTPPATVVTPASQPVPVPKSATPAAAPQPIRNWSLGAGVFGGGDGLAGAFNQVTPTYQTSLERRVGERTWLAFNARLSFDSTERLKDRSSANPTPTATTRIERTNVMGLLGARQIFVNGVVQVSGYSAILVGYHDATGDELGSASLLGAAGDGYDLGLLLGLAAERELLDALSLRLGFDLVSASISSDEALQQDELGNATRTRLGSGRAALSIQPSLQLHFYF